MCHDTNIREHTGQKYLDQHHVRRRKYIVQCNFVSRYYVSHTVALAIKAITSALSTERNVKLRVGDETTVVSGAVRARWSVHEIPTSVSSIGKAGGIDGGNGGKDTRYE